MWQRVPESLQGRGEPGLGREVLETVEAQNPFNILVLRGPADAVYLFPENDRRAYVV